ncbi:MAG: type II toxin-antitoxin system RelE/ParE family toxin [Bacteroidota bacterium]
MKVIWTNFAAGMLMQIYQYYKEKAGNAVSKKIKTEIFAATKQLKKYPTSGQIELNLEKLNENHRYLIVGNFKVIYREISEGVLITDVFDTRQDPVKINEENRTPEK